MTILKNLKKCFGLKTTREDNPPVEFKKRKSNFRVKFSIGLQLPEGMKIKVGDPYFLTEEGRRSVKDGIIEVDSDLLTPRNSLSK